MCVCVCVADKHVNIYFYYAIRQQRHTRIIWSSPSLLSNVLHVKFIAQNGYSVCMFECTGTCNISDLIKARQHNKCE